MDLNKPGPETIQMKRMAVHQAEVPLASRLTVLKR
jgi:hypothetical protein